MFKNKEQMNVNYGTYRCAVRKTYVYTNLHKYIYYITKENYIYLDTIFKSTYKQRHTKPRCFKKLRSIE